LNTVDIFVGLLNELWIEYKRRMLSTDRAEPKRARVWAATNLIDIYFSYFWFHLRWWWKHHC